MTINHPGPRTDYCFQNVKSINIPLSSIASAADFADATTCAAACVTPLDASDKGGKFGLSLAALTLEATTSCVVLAAISCEHTTSSSYFPSPLTTLSAESLFHQINHKRFNFTNIVELIFIKHHSKVGKVVSINFMHRSTGRNFVVVIQ